MRKLVLMGLCLALLLCIAAATAAAIQSDIGTKLDSVKGAVEEKKSAGSAAWNAGRSFWNTIKGAFWGGNSHAPHRKHAQPKHELPHGAAPELSAEEEAELKQQFTDFKVKFQRSYKDAEEEEMRFRAFVRNQHIAQEAQAANPEAKFGVNQFSDLTREELRQRMGVKPHDNKHVKSHEDKHVKSHEDKHVKSHEDKHVKSHDAKHVKPHEDKHVKSHEDKHVKSHEDKHVKSHDAKHVKSHEDKHVKSHEDKHVKSHDAKHVKPHEDKHVKSHEDKHVKSHEDVKPHIEALTHLKKAFEDFKKKYNKVYATEEEEQARFKNFLENMKEAEKLQAANPEAKFGVNLFADQSKDEMKHRKGLGLH